jgi:hypothetical protein
MPNNDVNIQPDPHDLDIPAIEIDSDWRTFPCQSHLAGWSIDVASYLISFQLHVDQLPWQLYASSGMVFEQFRLLLAQWML